jgi:amino acid permease
MLLSIFFSYICLTYVVEAISRSEAIIKHESIHDSSAQFAITSQQWTFTRMSALLGGQRAQFLVQFFMCIYCYGSLWSYTSVFASSATTFAFQIFTGRSCDVYEDPSSQCANAYLIAVAVYAIIVIIMSLMELKEQATVQMLLTAYRFIVRKSDSSG